MIFALVFEGLALLGAAALLLLAAPPLPLGAPALPGVAVTRVSVLAAVPPCGFTDWDALVAAGLSPALPPVFPLVGAFTF